MISNWRDVPPRNKRDRFQRHIGSVPALFVDPCIIVQFLQRKTQQDATACQNFLLFLILSESQHVSGDTPPIIMSLKLHKHPLVLHTWKVVGRVGVGRCQVAYQNFIIPYFKRSSTCFGRHTAHHHH